MRCWQIRLWFSMLLTRTRIGAFTRKHSARDDNPDYPQLTSVGNIIFAANHENPELITAVNETITELWADCSIRDIAAKYGLTDDHWFDPGPNNLRAGIDRPADWVQPNCAN